MRIAYLDCFAGIAGDMFLGALVNAGVPPDVLHQATAALDLGATLRIEAVDRSGISSTKVHVLEHGHHAEGQYDIQAHASAGDVAGLQQQAEHGFQHDTQLNFEHKRAAGDAHSRATATEAAPEHSHEHRHTHDYAEADRSTGHSHTHTSDGHVHGRSWSEIRKLIQSAELAGPVKAFAIHAFELLGASEARIHNVPVEQIHFHEVGAVDAIVDIVAVSAGVHHLGVDTWYASALNVGGGMVECAHGTFPVPAPATADLLRGVPTYSARVQKELVTPTGAALLRALHPSFGAQPSMRVESIGYGAGTRNPDRFPNVLRLSVGEAAGQPDLQDQTVCSGESQPSFHSEDPVSAASDSAEIEFASERHQQHQHHLKSETVTVLETALDDLSPQLLAYVAEKALAQGALDVMLTPVVMKKGRPGTLLTVLCNPAQSSAFTQMILSETSTLGVRIRQDRRVCLERSHTAVQTSFGLIRVKTGMQDGIERNAAPEYEDCRAAAERSGVPLKQVQQAALAAYAGKRER